MKNEKIICLSFLFMSLAGTVNSQVLTGSNVDVSMTSFSAPGIKVTSKPPLPNTSPGVVNLMEGWSGGNPFVVGVPPPKLVFNVNNYGNAAITNSLQIGPNATTGTSSTYTLSVKGNASIAQSLRIGATAATGAFANYKLSVDGDMIAKRCVVQVDNWADFVFNEDYLLPTLNEVEHFVKENKHLPGVLNEQEIKDKGVDVGEMNKILMQKVEELTLYMISQQKEIDALKAANAVR